MSEKKTDWGGIAVLVAIGVGAYLLTRPAPTAAAPTPAPTPTPTGTITPYEAPMPSEPVTPSAPTLGYETEEGRTVVFNPWIIQADKGLQGARWYEKLWFPQVTMHVMTPEERTQYLQRIDMMSEADRKAFYANYGMTKELNAILTGGWTEMWTIDKRIEFMISQRLLDKKPEEYKMTDPQYKAYYDWWKNVIATEDAKTIQAFQTWLQPKLQADASTINAFYDLVRNGVWYKTPEGKWDVLTNEYLATSTPGPGGTLIVKTEKGTETMTKKEYGDYVKKEEAEKREAKEKEEKRAEVRKEAAERKITRMVMPPKSTATVTPAKPPEPVSVPAPVSKPKDPRGVAVGRAAALSEGRAKAIEAKERVAAGVQRINLERGAGRVTR